MSTSSDPPPPLPPTTDNDLPPPDYVPSQPQVMITPLPDSASFFWGQTVQGEIYVKGLGEGRGDRTGIVNHLSVQLSLTNHLPKHPTISLHTFQPHTLYPPIPTSNISSSTPSQTAIPFSTCHRFSIPLPAALSSSPQNPLPGTLNLTSYEKGEIRYALKVRLTLPNGQVVEEDMKIEGTPQQIASSSSSSSPFAAGGGHTEVEEKLEKNGVLARLLLDKDQPRLGELLRLGLEICPVERKKGTAVFDLAKQSDPTETLRPLRRVRVELFRRVVIHSPSPTSSTSTYSSSSNQASSSTSTATATANTGSAAEHLTLLHSTGKSLRYPGTGKKYPPLRVLFTVPTAQLGVVAEQTWGEITCSSPYHTISFFIKVTIGFGDISASRDWTLTRGITIKPKKWEEPRQVVVERGLQPDLGNSVSSNSHSQHQPTISGESVSGDADDLDMARNGRQDSWSEEEYRREAYRQKGRDVVGESGTFRLADNDLPPPFLEEEGQAGPSRSGGQSHDNAILNANANAQQNELPSFLESEEQARTGEIPTLNETVRSERLLPVNFDNDNEQAIIDEQESRREQGDEDVGDRNNWVGRRGSLGGELGTWVEYDGYETFSVAPPSMSASYGANGPMDPPQEGDEANAGLVGGMVARLGLDGEGVGGVRMQGLELMEHLGLGEGTRIVDLQDDLPPGIDEPSLPALPDFHSHSHSHPHPASHPHSHGRTHQNPSSDAMPMPMDIDIDSNPPPPAHAPYISPPAHPHALPPVPVHDPPSFDASQAANAVGGVATSHIRANTSTNTPNSGNGVGSGAAPIAVSHGVGGRRPSRHAIDDAVGVIAQGDADAPPGYERAGEEQGLPPSYS
ncbi:uncharacterized protein I303_101308 [Kwoniella dejecticola CBS 10117]|uniref:Uncharacterized protein n=1 Tax=Kwoniella dejecticola CBS 10117 TaxID=1296121 RepID=A0A1A6AHE8_9TREE|nr:uncharacterized protein I303_01316 [Kwoniella dejecticola CBS 10117]OBR89489.1 hypothetical protein I303_01316 [Kwoniella dejecticola CBS 10117]